MEKPREVKVVLLGDTGVGKSSIVRRFVTFNFYEAEAPTLAVEFVNKTVSVNDQQLRYQIWDTAGQERFRSLAPMYYRGVAAVILVYDITNEESFISLKRWVDELRVQVVDKIAIAIAGNKLDLESKRKVNKEVASNYAEEISAIHIETSAKEGNQIDELFHQLGERLPPVPKATQDNSTLRLTDADVNSSPYGVPNRHGHSGGSSGRRRSSSSSAGAWKSC